MGLDPASGRPDPASWRAEPACGRPEPASKGPETASWRAEPASGRPEPVSGRPEPASVRLLMDGQMDGWTDVSTDFPSILQDIILFRPLLCLLPHCHRHVDGQGKGIGDHLLPLGDWLRT